MSLEENDGVAPSENFAIGISFGNSNSSIAHTFGVLKHSRIPCKASANSFLAHRMARQKSLQMRKGVDYPRLRLHVSGLTIAVRSADTFYAVLH